MNTNKKVTDNELPDYCVKEWKQYLYNEIADGNLIRMKNIRCSYRKYVNEMVNDGVLAWDLQGQIHMHLKIVNKNWRAE